MGNAGDSEVLLVLKTQEIGIDLYAQKVKFLRGSNTFRDKRLAIDSRFFSLNSLLSARQVNRSGIYARENR
jgi:hypothetical protein